MSLHGKFFWGLVFLLIFASGIPLQAQWEPFQGNSQMDGFSGRGQCRDITVMVTDSMGTAITGAAVSTEENGFESTTDSQGFASVPCRTGVSMLPVLNVSASGYRSTRVSLMPDGQSHFTVRLDSGTAVTRSAGTTVNASELSANVQKQSAQLQFEAERALAAKDYDSAEKLLNEALRFTPSSAPIANNLGIVALHRKDLDTAASWFQKASEEAPYKADILGNLGLVRWMQNRLEESYEILSRAFSRGYQSALGEYILGTVGLEKGESKQAAEHLKKTPQDRFRYRDLYLSIALRNCGKTKAADESYRNFLRHNPAPFLVTLLR